ncbi:unnamed protein product [Litomosoides sigmodontis]|uniref:Neurotransmitter-gated ion-channel ligand-binding domain-containing protein n=1 Tax=Litomosoides sigmodontis TaxID=42156 RepID=A0A3P6TME1_LITSI|nr:unnamed protein product [Litomosoides sigmodontis]
MNLKSFFAFAVCIIVEVLLSHTSVAAERTLTSELWINTTYQAEDVGIRCEKLPQCDAWNSWWKVQAGNVTPTVETIDLLLTRKAQIALNSTQQLAKFGLPKYLLAKYKIVHINFKKVCGNYSRYLLINSVSTALEHSINLTEICNNYEAKKKFLGVDDSGSVSSDFSANTEKSRNSDQLKLGRMKRRDGLRNDGSQRLERSVSRGIRVINPRAEITYQISASIEQLPSMITVRDQKLADSYKLGDMTSIFEFHKGLKIDIERICAPQRFNAANKSKATKILESSNAMVSNDEKDYDMDMWLRMAWRDQRLAHQFDRPILVNDENTLKKIWRPAPFFQNAKEARYHRMTTLNFWSIYLKPSCKLILCKYPHDNQVCSLKIVATSGQSSIRYIWFPRLSDAIRMNKRMEEELYVDNYYKTYCNGVRKTGNFSCLEASCRLKRSLGHHMTRTYIPTAICVVFSWISVWLPEEFVTGRIFGSLTLFLTLSAESYRSLVWLYRKFRLYNNARGINRHLTRIQIPAIAEESGVTRERHVSISDDVSDVEVESLSLYRPSHR